MKEGVNSPVSLEKIRCPLCEGREYKKIYHIKGYNIVKCQGCSLIFINPRPRVEDIEKFYQKGYFRSSDELSCGYNHYEDLREDLIRTFKRRLKKFDSFLPTGKEERLLDIGCGFGYFLEAAGTNFHEYWGVDISETACKKIEKRGFKTFRGNLKEANFKNYYFDLIVTTDLLEHLPHPRPFLREVIRILKPEGVVMITTPNVKSLLSRVSKRKWVSFKLPEHLVYYSPETLSRMLREEGFRIIKIAPEGQYCSLKFLSERVAGLNPVLGKPISFLIDMLGLGEWSLYVNSGSMTVIARHN